MTRTHGKDRARAEADAASVRMPWRAPLRCRPRCVSLRRSMAQRLRV